jgi:hypothetical protein
VLDDFDLEKADSINTHQCMNRLHKESKESKIEKKKNRNRENVLLVFRSLSCENEIYVEKSETSIHAFMYLD